MPVELRKRPAPKETATPPPTAKRGSGSNPIKKLADKAKEAILPQGKNGKKSNGTSAPVADASSVTPSTNSVSAGGSKIAVGETVNLEGLGGTVQTHDGKDTTLKQLVDESLAGVAIFTYPKASTPGCTTQACLFRDNYAPITGASLSVFGLSTDSPKANTTFATKQKLPYPLLCDPNATLTSAIGLKKPGPGKSTARGVIVIDKQGKIRVYEQAGPQKTLDAVLEYIKTEGFTETGAPAAVAAPPADDPAATEEAAKLADPKLLLADPDVKMDEVPLVSTPSRAEEEAANTAAEVGETAAKIDSADGLVKA